MPEDERDDRGDDDGDQTDEEAFTQLFEVLHQRHRAAKSSRPRPAWDSRSHSGVFLTVQLSGPRSRRHLLP